MSGNTWDGIDLGLDGGDFITLRDVGDEATGVLKSVKMHDFGDGQGPKPQLTLVGDDGTERILTAGPFQLRQLIDKQKPEIGDKVKVVLVRLEPRAKGTAKIFTLDVAKPVATALPGSHAVILTDASVDKGDPPPF